MYGKRQQNLRLEQLESRIALSVGDLDPTFAGDGTLEFNFDFTDSLSSLVVQGDGKFVAGGKTGSDFALARFNGDGSLDTSFGIGGRTQTNFQGLSNDFILDLALQADGKIVAVGQSILGVGRIALARYNADGSLDLTFGKKGIVITQLIPGFSSDKGEAVLIDPDGNILVGGQTDPDAALARSQFAVLRYDSTGKLDKTFGINGKVTVDLGFGSNEAKGMALLEDGKIILAGHRDSGQGVVVLRFTATGVLDDSFGTDGQVTTNIEGFSLERANDVAIQSDGKIVVVGNLGNASNNSDILILRYTALGELDDTFSDDGIITLDLGGTSEGVEAVLIAPQDRIVVAGKYQNGSDGFNLLARFNSDGSPDANFGSAANVAIPGVVITDVGTTTNGYADVLLQTDGFLVASGTVRLNSDSNFGVARYESENLAPTADAGTAYEVVEDGTAFLDGLRSTDPEQPATTLVYTWDLDGDGTFGEIGINAVNGDETGPTPTFQAVGLDGPTSVTVTLRVTDVSGNTDEADATITITNDTPNILSFGSVTTGLSEFMQDEAISFAAGFADSGSLDTHTAVIDWGDGSAPESATVTEAEGVGEVTANHAYAQGGNYLVTLTLTDDEGAATTATTMILVTGIGLNNGVLQIIGTAGADIVTITPTGSDVTVNATLNGTVFTESFPAVDVIEIVMLLFGAADRATVDSTILLKTMIDGGPGSDVLQGGGGSNVLLGGGGADKLIGGAARDILLGGKGADVLRGGLNDDILIGGSSAFESKKNALDAVLAEWTSNRDFPTRRLNLRGIDNVEFDNRANGDIFLLKSGKSATVFDDLAADRIKQKEPMDFLFSNLGDLIQ